jgi:membrane fusion protein, copper/silver efflux system
MKYIISILVLLVFFSCKEKKQIAEQDPNVSYTCPMHPEIVQDKPGSCPICGMDLVKVEKKNLTADESIMLSDQQIQLGNIKVDTIGNGTIGDETILTATLNIDETKSTTVSARIGGRIERLYFKNEGDYIPKGAKLYDLYSEQLNNAKQEYILALEKQRLLDNSIVDLKQLVQSAKTKLLLWGMSEAQISELERTKKASTLTSFYNPASGYVTMLEGHEGDYISEGGTIVRLANLSSLWAEAQVYTSQLSEFDAKDRQLYKFLNWVKK